MKKLIPVLVIALGVGGYFLLSSLKGKKTERSIKAYERSTVLPEGIDSSYVSYLSALGFSGNADVQIFKYTQKRKYWFDKYGLSFIGDAEMTKFLTDNDFIIGESSRYIGSVPPEAGKLMADNYNRLTDTTGKGYEPFSEWIKIMSPVQQSNDGMIIMGWGGSGYIEPKILIIAGVNKFNTEGMQIVDKVLKAIAPADPIAVMKVEEGYVELANW